uniref:Erythropoietin n=1 Tax=Gopherus evgoodei TaxID=1825980 RepID=A0A8C4YTW9_9SAUR
MDAWRGPSGSQHSPPPGLCALLLLLLGLAALTHPSPLHPICDTRVMEKFIKEARDTENAVEGCTNSCNLSEVLTVPDTKVNFNEWKKMDVSLNRAAEVWGGQALLSAAVLRARALVPDPSLNQQLGRTYSNLRSITQILRKGRRMDGRTDGRTNGWMDEWSMSPVKVPPLTTAPRLPQVEPALPPAPPPTLSIRTLAKLLSVHSNFLRGRVKLFLTDACRPDTR